MRKYIYILAASVILSSCVDLKQEPKSSLTQSTLPVTVQSLEATANGLYSDFWGENFGFNCRVASLALAGDDMITGAEEKVRNSQDDQMNVPSDSPDVRVLWQHFYKTIFSANNIISLVSNNTTVKKEEVAQYLGEAYFMRALSYFYVVRYWGDVPAIVDATSGTDIEGSEKMPRRPVKTIYERIIIPDLQKAEELLGDNSRDEKNQSPTKWAAKTMLSHVYLTMAGWPIKDAAYYPLAAAKAKEVIEQGPYSLLPEYKSLWLNANRFDKTEHIFAIRHSLTYLPSQYATSYLGKEEGGWNDYVADPVFFNNFPEDARKEFSYVTETFDTKTGATLRWQDSERKAPFIRKYRNYGNCGKYGIEGSATTKAPSSLSEGVTSIYRYADLLLFYAEASNMAEGSPNTLAYKCLNDVRARAGLPALSGLSKDQFNEAVFNEFGWETVFEFKRWFQLVRTERVDEKLKVNTAVGARVDVNKQNYLYPVPIRQCELRGWANNAGY